MEVIKILHDLGFIFTVYGTYYLYVYMIYTIKLYNILPNKSKMYFKIVFQENV